jgi:hypothetical protein
MQVKADIHQDNLAVHITLLKVLALLVKADLNQQAVQHLLVVERVLELLEENMMVVLVTVVEVVVDIMVAAELEDIMQLVVVDQDILIQQLQMATVLMQDLDHLIT